MLFLISMLQRLLIYRIAPEISKHPETVAITRSFRLLRVLRPLRSIQRIPKLKSVVNALLKSVKNVGSIITIYFMFLYIYALMGTQILSGDMFYCTDKKITKKSECQYVLELIKFLPFHFIDYSYFQTNFTCDIYFYLSAEDST